MTFNPRKFGNLGSHVKSGTSFQLFSYLSDDDNKAEIVSAGYFNSVKESLKRNDRREIKCGGYCGRPMDYRFNRIQHSRHCWKNCQRYK